MNKRKSNAFGKDVYLLGINEHDELVWLEAASWDCDWYWGFGYVEVYTNQEYPNRSHDISSHSHFDGLVWFKNKNNDYIHHLNESPRMKETVLSDNESWELSDLMKSFYALREAVAVIRRGGSHLSSTKNADFSNKEIARQINEDMMPVIFKRVYEILSP